jgi:putative redox protein
MQFVGTSGSGHGIVVDAARDDGGFDAGPSNTELLLIALCGCTGMDVISILQKKRLKIDDFEVYAEGDIEEGPPKQMNRIRLVYRIWGENVTESALEQAIELSKEKYCTVSNTLKGVAEIDHRYEINPVR